jgi:hypothetical protein
LNTTSPSCPGEYGQHFPRSRARPFHLRWGVGPASRGYRPLAVRGFNTLAGDRFVSIWEKE